jgi:hypothetical protein
MFGNLVDTNNSQSNSFKKELFGVFIEPTQEQLSLNFSPYSIPFTQRWRNNGLSADYIGDFIATLFPKEEMESISFREQGEIKSSAVFIINELLENAIKFCYYIGQYPINVSFKIESKKIIFYVTNPVSQLAANKFQVFIKELLQSDPNDLYIRQLEKNAEDEYSFNSGLGLLTIINDYNAQMAWKFQTIKQDVPQVIAVTCMVQLTL